MLVFNLPTFLFNTVILNIYLLLIYYIKKKKKKKQANVSF